MIGLAVVVVVVVVVAAVAVVALPSVLLQAKIGQSIGLLSQQPMSAAVSADAVLRSAALAAVGTAAVAEFAVAVVAAVAAVAARCPHQHRMERLDSARISGFAVAESDDGARYLRPSLGGSMRHCPGARAHAAGETAIEQFAAHVHHQRD